MALWNHTEANLTTEELIFVTSDVAVKVLKIIPLALVMLASIVGNAIVIHAVYTDIRMQTATNMLIVSQALADFGTSILVIPFALVSVGADGWIFGEKFCFANGFLNLFFTQTTVLQMTIIAVERYLVIVRPLLRAISLRDAMLLAALAWGVSFLGAFPWLPLLTNHVKVEFFAGFYVCGRRYLHPLRGLALFSVISLIFVFAVMPLFLILYCYYQIGKVIRRKNHSVCPIALSNAQKLAINVYASSALTSKIVIGTSLFQVFPACFMMLLDGLQVGHIPRGFKTSFKWLMWCHCIVKPIIYSLKSPTWAKIIRKYLGKFPLCSAIFGVRRLNKTSISVFANRFKQYKLSKRKNGTTTVVVSEATKQIGTSERKEQTFAWFLTERRAWETNENPEEFSTF
ncbi:trace amine-associated receptor 1-like [Montipora foliosa]|uniref:trace amine-associated receptor 1-like n=1 Tax=Montipora foliosa TaxID=591990 RepID=UPI0035F14D5F